MASVRFLFCFVVLFVVCRENACGESFLNKLDVNLRSELSTVLQDLEVNYTVPHIVTEVNSSLEFDMRGMKMLYTSTVPVINAIVKKDAYPEGFITIEDGHVRVMEPADNWQLLASHYSGPLTVIVLCILLVVVLPLAGLLWCCCYCCRYGRRRRPFDRKFDSCFKALYAILLIALLTLFLFGVVCAFASDEHLEMNVRSAPTTGRRVVIDVNNYINSTQVHMEWLFITNWKQLEELLNDKLNDSGKTISSQLGEFSRAVSVTTLNKMVQQLDSVQEDLRTVQNLTSALRYNAEHLNSGLRKVKAQLLNTLASCEQPQCRKLQEKYKIGQLDTEIQYSQMPDVSELLNNVTTLLDSDIKREVADGHKVLTDIQRGIRRSVDENIPYVTEEIANIGKRLKNASDTISFRLTDVRINLKEESEAAFIQMEYGMEKYGLYRRYAGLGVASALLVITCFVALGLVCGICGKRPDVYGASDCCNKGAGSKWLLCGMGVTFIVGGVVCATLLIYFLVGIASQRIVCDPLYEPQGNRLVSDLEKFVNIEREMFGENTDKEFTMTNIIMKCHNNQTIYETLSLERILDLNNIKTQVHKEVSRRVEQLRPRYPAAARDVRILSAAARARLTQLAHTGLSDFNFDRILSALETNITSLSLDALSRQLHGTADELRGRAGFTHVTMELRDAANMLATYHRDIVHNMMSDTARLTEVTLSLRDGLRFNHSTMKDAVIHLLQESQDAEVFLNTQGPALIQNLTDWFAGAVADSIDVYLSHVQDSLQHSVGNCAPVSHAYNATYNAFCRKIVMPTNGYWMSLAWCVLLFVPILVVSQKLARLYLHVDPYPGPLVEAEYLYDAYADRDNVPLANSYKADKQRSRRTPTAGQAREGPAPAPVDAHHARRYNDMAPKHWEEGPPRYHGPTEYERPPPYYYPGSTDTQ